MIVSQSEFWVKSQVQCIPITPLASQNTVSCLISSFDPRTGCAWYWGQGMYISQKVCHCSEYWRWRRITKHLPHVQSALQSFHHECNFFQNTLLIMWSDESIMVLMVFKIEFSLKLNYLCYRTVPRIWSD